MKRIFEGFDQIWSVLKSASHATAFLLLCQRTFVLHQNAGRPMIGDTFCKYPLQEKREFDSQSVFCHALRQPCVARRARSKKFF